MKLKFLLFFSFLLISKNLYAEFTEPTTSMKFEKGKTYYAIILTNKGEIECQLFPDSAPLSVTNFIGLANKDFYKNLTFHRVIPNFMIQGGDPTGTGRGGPGYTLPAEIKLKHGRGALAWARLGDQVNPLRRSSGSQFYITHLPTPHLDGAYTVFGTVVRGMEVVNQIVKGDVIKDIKIITK